MRVALITVAYPPVRSSVAVQMRDLAREFAAQGHSPLVLVPDATISRPWVAEVQDGIRVLRLRAFKSRDVNYLRRTLAEFLLPWAMLRGFRKSPYARERVDAIVWYSPPIFFGPLINRLKRQFKCPSYLILRDIFPQWAVDLGLMKRGAAFQVFKWVERQQHAAADVIGIQAPSNRSYLTGAEEKRRPRIELLWNWLAPAHPNGCSIDLASGPLRGRTIFVYAGNMGVAQGIDVMLELARALRHRTDIGFLFVGRGSEVERLRASAVADALDNVVFHDEIEPDEIPGLLAQCQIGLLALDPRHKTHNIPGKFLAYVQAGLPVLARINANNDLVKLIEAEGVGRVDTGESLESLRAAAEAMANDRASRDCMASTGRVLAQRLFSPRAAVEQILRSLSEGAAGAAGDGNGR